MTDLTKLYDVNRRWRKWMDEHTKFVTPSILDALRYALCEACEAMDVWLRQKNQAHARNNERNHDLHEELADCAMMLLTALDEARTFAWPDVDDVFAAGDLDGVCSLITAATTEYKQDFFYWRPLTWQALKLIAIHPGMNLEAELDKCHRRLAQKQGIEAYRKAFINELLNSTEIW